MGMDLLLKQYILTGSDGAWRVKVRGTGRFAYTGEERPPYRLLGIDHQYYSCCMESREVKEDKYCPERSDRSKLVSIEQAKD